MFSWLAFVRRHHLEYSEGGAHTHAGNLYLPCPFCNDPEGKHRMGLHLASPVWGCWRNPKHRGSDPVRLIRALLRCSWTAAVQEAKDDTPDRSSTTSLKERLALMGEQKRERVDATLPAPKGLVPISGAVHPPEAWALAYLRRRGFPGQDADRLCEQYDLTCGTEGRWQNRIVIPLCDLKGRTVAWTGRHVGNSPLRYDTEGPTGNVLYNGRKVAREGGKVLALVEGPFDCLKIDFYGKAHGLRATALIGLGGAGKVGLIARVFERGGFERLLVLLDRGAQGLAQQLRRDLLPLPADLGRLVRGCKDPGELQAAQVRALAVLACGPSATQARA